jgi:hypothetical protein
MHCMVRFRFVSILLLVPALLTACWDAGVGDDASSSSSSSFTEVPAVVAPGVSVLEERPSQFLTQQGVVQSIDTPAGPSYVLALSTGVRIFLASDVVHLEEFIGANVRVSGRTTVSADGSTVSMDVATLDDLSIVPQDQQTSTSAMSSEASSAVQSSSVQSSVRTVASSSSWAESSFPAKIASSPSSSSISSSSASSQVAATSKETVMQKSTIEAQLFTQQYCSTNIGFCVSLHKHWYYQSFGRNVPPALWHVEVGPEPVENVGDGVLIISLLSGDIPDGGSDMSVERSGDFVVVYRQWTNDRYFSVSAPSSLESAAKQVATSIAVYSAQ